MVGVTRMVRKAGRRRGCGRNAYSRVMARAGRTVTVLGGRKSLLEEAPACRSHRAGASAGTQTLIRSKDFSQACISVERSADEAAALVARMTLGQ